MRIPAGWIDAAIVLLAFGLRIVALSLKPPHFDEGVNGWWVDQITQRGYYPYDPGFFHGPLHFYILFVFQTLLGRHVWALRLPVVLFSTGCVALMLAYRHLLGRRPCQIAALAMAVSPGMVFYGRYAIHESEQVFFLMLAVWGGATWMLEKGPGQTARRGPLWLAALSLAGMVLTKETYAVHFVAFALAFPTLWLWERISPSAPAPFARPDWQIYGEDVINSGCVGVCFILFFYSGGFLDPSSLPGLWQAFAKWGAVGMNGDTGHEKSPFYWLGLLAHYEWPALLGLAAVVWLLWPRGPRFARYLAIYSLGALTAYSIIRYKTPWCIISIMWPFFLFFGLAVERLAERFNRVIVGAATAVLLVASLGWSLRLNFWHFVDEEHESYVYVQTAQEIHLLLDPLAWLVARDPLLYHAPGHVLIPIEESHPLPWLLGDFTRVDFLDPKNPPAQMDAAFLVVDDSIVSDTEERLNESYFKESFLLRNSSNQSVTIYLDAKLFGPLFPGREPEFQPPPTDMETPKEKP